MTRQMKIKQICQRGNEAVKKDNENNEHVYGTSKEDDSSKKQYDSEKNNSAKMDNEDNEYVAANSKEDDGSKKEDNSEKMSSQIKIIIMSQKNKERNKEE